MRLLQGAAVVLQVVQQKLLTFRGGDGNTIAKLPAVAERDGKEGRPPSTWESFHASGYQSLSWTERLEQHPRHQELDA